VIGFSWRVMIGSISSNVACMLNNPDLVREASFVDFNTLCNHFSDSKLVDCVL
jgi:hypothetical protein